jgi:hypothetical protein
LVYFDIAIPRSSYFVLEHQPQKCNELPANGIVRWTDIEVEIDNKKISEPVWHAVEESPKCKSKAVVVNSTCVEITWDADAPAEVVELSRTAADCAPAGWH